MTDERLIEAARVAFTEAWEAERKKIGRGIAEPGTKTRAGIRAAFAVFEAAHAPTDDEREALIDVLVMTKLSDYAATDMSTIHQAVDAIIKSDVWRFRRPAQVDDGHDGWCGCMTCGAELLLAASKIMRRQSRSRIACALRKMPRAR